MSPDISNTSTTTVSLNSKNVTQYPVVLVFPKVLPTAALVQVASDNMKLQSSVRDCVKVTNLTHSMVSSIPTVIPARLIFESTALKQQSVPKSYLLDHETD